MGHRGHRTGFRKAECPAQNGREGCALHLAQMEPVWTTPLLSSPEDSEILPPLELFSIVKRELCERKQFSLLINTSF